MDANIGREFHGVAMRAAKACDALAALKQQRRESQSTAIRRQARKEAAAALKQQRAARGAARAARRAEIVAMRKAGMTIMVIARFWHVSKQRIFQILVRAEKR